jgi:hypothetical protein
VVVQGETQVLVFKVGLQVLLDVVYLCHLLEVALEDPIMHLVDLEDLEEELVTLLELMKQDQELLVKVQEVLEVLNLEVEEELDLYLEQLQLVVFKVETDYLQVLQAQLLQELVVVELKVVVEHQVVEQEVVAEVLEILLMQLMVMLILEAQEVVLVEMLIERVLLVERV